MSLHCFAVEKTREYELIWTVESGVYVCVSELSTVHALRRDGGEEAVASDAECVGKKKEVGLRLEQRYCVKTVGPTDVGVASMACCSGGSTFCESLVSVPNSLAP